MKYASDHPHRVTVLLNGKDVTNICAGFDVEAQQVELYEQDAHGKKILEHVCERGHVLPTPRKPFGLIRCPQCDAPLDTKAKKTVYSGRVTVLPVNPADTDLRT